MKIALINPPFLFPDRKQIAMSHCLGLRYISANLKTCRKHKVQFIDALAEGITNIKPYANGIMAGLEIDEIVARIEDQTQLVGISVPFSQLAPIAHDLTDRIKQRLPETAVIMGGVYPSTQPDLALSSAASAIVVGEGEMAMLDIADQDAKNLDDIQGVYCRQSADGNYRRAESADDLDALPRPDEDIPVIDEYFRLSPRMAREAATASIVTSRGCPFGCEFCSVHPICGKKWRAMSAQRVIEDIEHLARVRGVRAIEIEDDNFTLDPARTAAILRGIIQLNRDGCDISWSAPNGVRIDTLDKEIIALIAASNCTSLAVALEHGDEQMLQIMNKKLDLDKAYDVIRMLLLAGIERVVVFVIVGYPGETEQRFENSLAYLKKLRGLKKFGKIIPCINFAQPYPGTTLLKRCMEHSYIADKDFANFLIRKDLLSTSHTVSITTGDFNAPKVRHRKQRILSVLPDVNQAIMLLRRVKRYLRPFCLTRTQPTNTT